jgi:hypothetical protein
MLYRNVRWNWLIYTRTWTANICISLRVSRFMPKLVCTRIRSAPQSDPNLNVIAISLNLEQILCTVERFWVKSVVMNVRGSCKRRRPSRHIFSKHARAFVRCGLVCASGRESACSCAKKCSCCVCVRCRVITYGVCVRCRVITYCVCVRCRVITYCVCVRCRVITYCVCVRCRVITINFVSFYPLITTHLAPPSVREDILY